MLRTDVSALRDQGAAGVPCEIAFPVGFELLVARD
jgi:hypothetical protein